MDKQKNFKKLDEDIRVRSQELYNEHRQAIYVQTDGMFSWFLILQWLGGIACAFWVSPRTWAGVSSQTHFHVWVAVLLGGLITLFPAYLAHKKPGQPMTRYTVGVAQMLFGALLIHLTGGRIETHFHVFGSLAFLAFYRDEKVLLPATVVVAFDHWFRGVYWPQSVYGILAPEPFRWLEHAGWVVFEDIFLLMSCVRSQTEMREIAERRARDERQQQIVEMEIASRTAELQEAQSKLMQAQKMESLGHLAGSIAHDLNNQLTPVRGYLDMILLQIPQTNEIRPLLEEASQASLRSTEIVQRLLNFSKPSTQKMQPVHVDKFVAEIQKMLPQIIPATIQTSVSIDPDLWMVNGNETDLQTVIVNFVSNARDAMRQGGRLTIRAEKAYVGGVTVSHGTLTGPHVVISVVDSGTGMTPEVLQRVFEPFFSTKGRTEGTGLGLSMAFNIAKAHGGWMDVSTELGKGSSFQLYLPAITDANVLTVREGDSVPRAAMALNAEGLPKGSGLVLFVDDEERIRTMGKVFLEALGYSVMLAKDGADAVEKYMDNRDKITAVVSDMTMPRMTGRQMLKELLDTNPKLTVILASGYTEEGTHDELIRLGAADFIQKPYTINQLASSMHKHIGSPPKTS